MTTYKTPLNGPVNAVCYDARSCQYSALLSRARGAEALNAEWIKKWDAAEEDWAKEKARADAAEAEVARLKKRVAFLTDGRE